MFRRFYKKKFLYIKFLIESIRMLYWMYQYVYYFMWTKWDFFFFYKIAVNKHMVLAFERRQEHCVYANEMNCTLITNHTILSIVSIVSHRFFLFGTYSWHHTFHMFQLGRIPFVSNVPILSDERCFFLTSGDITNSSYKFNKNFSRQSWIFFI